MSAQPEPPTYWRANRHLFLAVPFWWAFMHLQPYSLGGVGEYALAYLFCGFAGVTLTVKGLRVLWRNYRMRRDWDAASAPFVEKHHGRFMSQAEKAALGMYDPKSGRLLGLDPDNGCLLFAPPKTNFHMIYGGQGAMKTTSQASPSALLTPLLKHPKTGARFSVWINDCKDAEISVPLVKSWEKLGLKVDFLNPCGIHADLCPHANYNVYEAAIDSYWSDDPQKIKNTTSFMREMVDVATPPADKSANNSYFIDNGRRSHSFLMGDLVLTKPEEATPSRVYRIAADPDWAKDRVVWWAARRDLSEHDKVAQDIQRSAHALLSIISEEPKHWGDFLSYVTNGLAIFDQSGHLAEEGEYAVKRFADLRNTPTVLGNITPLDKMVDYSVYTEMQVKALLQACKMHPDGLPLHEILDEFILNKFPGYERAMLTMRGLGLSGEHYIQDRNALADQYGERAAAAIFDQCDLQSYLSINNLNDARELSEAMGTVPRRRQSTSRAGGQDTEFSVSEADDSVPVMSPQQLLTLPKDEQIIRVRSQHFIRCKKVPYWAIAGLKDFYGENPLEGKAPKVKPVAKLKITKNGAKVVWPKPPKSFQQPKAKKTRLLTAKSFIWAYVWGAIWMGAHSLALVDGLNNVGILYDHQSGFCRYWALGGERFIVGGDYCYVIQTRET